MLLRWGLKWASHFMGFLCMPVMPIFLGCLFLFYRLRHLIWLETVTVAHDAAKFYGFFHYFIQNLQHGVFPLWVPYSHAGEPFWSYIQLCGLTNPMVTVVGIFAILFNIQNLSLLYHWHIFLSILCFNIFTCLLIFKLFPGNRNRLYYWWLIPIVFLGTFTCVAWHQTAIVSNATYYPLALYLLIICLQQRDRGRIFWPLWIVLGVVLGIQLSMGNPLFFAVAFIVGALAIFLWWLELRGLSLKIEFIRFLIPVATLVGTAVVFGAPSILMVQEQDQLFAIGRHDSQTQGEIKNLLVKNSEVVRDMGTAAKWGDFYRPIISKGSFTSINFIMGVGGFCLFLIGLLVTRRVQIPLLAAFLFLALLSLGAKGGISPLLYKWLPFFGAIRHTHFFTIYAYLFATFFLALGCRSTVDFLSKKLPMFLGGPVFIGILLLICFSSNRDYFRSMFHQKTPYLFSQRFPYEGNRYHPRRVYKLPPFEGFIWNRDGFLSFGEPLLLYTESARFFDNGVQLTMPNRYWRFLKKGSPDAKDLLGISEDKIRMVKLSKSEYRLRVTNFNSNRIGLEVETHLPGTLFISQNRFPGTKLRLNGKKRPVTQIERHPFYEVSVPAGRSRVELSYLPISWITAFVINYLGQFFVMMGAVYIVCISMLRRANILRNWAQRAQRNLARALPHSSASC